MAPGYATGSSGRPAAVERVALGGRCVVRDRVRGRRDRSDVSAERRRARGDPAARARATAAGSAARSASTSASVVSWPRVKRRAPRASASGDAHRQQHVRGLGHARLAGGAGRDGEAGDVEQEEQRVALAAGEGEVGVAGQATGRIRVAAQHGAGDRGEDARHEPVAQRRQPRERRSPTRASRARPRRRTRRARGILGARTPALLVAAVQQRLDRRGAARAAARRCRPGRRSCAPRR